MRAYLRIAAVVASLGLLVVAGAASYGSSSANIHVVQPGDTLWAISRADHLTVAELAAANGMRPSDILLIGRHLVIPSTGSSTPTAGAATSSGGGLPSVGQFCATFTPPAGPWGVLPARLAASPSRLALAPIFDRWSRYYGVNEALVKAIAWQESGWQEGVVSSANAVGVGQLLPSTADFVSTQLVGEPLDIHSTADNIRMSVAFLAYLAHVEGNNRCATIAAYYEGPVNLGRVGVYRDTQAYVASVEALIPRFE